MQQVTNEPNTSNDADYYSNKALQYQKHNDLINAIKYAKLAIKHAPSNDRFLHLLGVLYKYSDDNESAAYYINQAIALNKSNFLYYFNLGIAYKELEKFEDSLQAQQCAIALSKNNIPCLNEMGLLCTKLKRLSEAEETLLNAHKLDVSNITTCINLSHFYVIKEDVRKTIHYANMAIRLNPARPEPYNNIGTAFFMANCYSEGVDYLRLSLQNHPKNASLVHQSMLMSMLYADSYSPEAIFEEHINWADQYLEQKIFPPTNDKKCKNKILNVGFISSDLKNHSISHFLTPLLENLNQYHFQITCYSSTQDTDDVTQKIKQRSTFWWDISNYDTKKTVNLIKKNKIDILIDLAGHSLGHNIAILAQKPAPIQMTYLGYPFSTGLRNIDYRITDDVTDPKNSTAHIHTEKLLKLSPSFLCYQPERTFSISKEPPIKHNGYTTFGSFNNLSKLSRSTIQVWAEILTRVKKSQILLKSTHTISDALKDWILSTFDEFNIHQNRIILYHATPTKNEHFAMYSRVDIALDPFPYNGTTTTYEAIYMGVPVIVLTGFAHYERVGYGILKNLGLTELIAESIVQYVNIAESLSHDTIKLSEYRRSLRSKLLSSPLTDAKSFSEKFENLLRKAWHTYCDELSELKHLGTHMK